MATISIFLRTNKKPTKEGAYPIAIQIIKNRKQSITHIGYNIRPEYWNEKKQRVRRSHPLHEKINQEIINRFDKQFDALFKTATEIDAEREKDDFLLTETEPGEINSNTSDVETSFPVVQSIQEQNAFQDTEVKQNCEISETGTLVLVAPPVLVPVESYQIKKEDKLPSFFTIADDYLDTAYKAKKFHDYNTEKPKLNKFRRWLENGDINFSDITPHLLTNFKSHVKSLKTSKGTFLTERTAVNHLVVIRRIYKHANGLKIKIPEEYYPFGKDGVKLKLPDSVKIGLNKEEVNLLEGADLSEFPLLDHVRNLWLYSFYFAGIRVGDVLLSRWTTIHDGRLSYVMGKNGKVDSLKIPEKAQKILDKYKYLRLPYNLVFPNLQNVKNITDEWEVKMRIKSHVRDIDERLRILAEMLGIKKKLTMHIARHTFGNIAGDKVSIQKLQKLYRHIHISTTVGYQQNFIHDETDKALETILEF